MTAYSIPSLTTIGLLFAGGLAAVGAAVWIVAAGDTDYEINSFPPLLGGMILLMIAFVLFALRLINQRHGTTPPQP
jgi:hypothetical protein